MKPDTNYYPELRAEMARKNISVTMIASDPRIRRTVSTMSMKLTGKADLLLREAITIKQILGTNTPIEILFQTKTTE